MRIFALCLSLLVTSNLYAAECDTSAMVDNCSVAPAAAKFRFLAIGLCSGPPILPAVGTAFNYDNCTLIYDKLNQDGQVIEWNGKGDSGFLFQDLIIPPNGTYDYFVWGNGLTWEASVAMEFATSTKTVGSSGAGTSGKFCRTINGTFLHSDGYRLPTAECSDSYQTPEFAEQEFWVSGGIDTTGSFNSNYNSYYIKSDLTLATTFSDAVAVISVHQPSSPIVITDQTTELVYDWDFDELIRIQTTSSGTTDWFLPLFGYPALSISTN